MGKFDFQLNPDLVKQLEGLENVDEIAPGIINGAMPILESKVKSEVARHKRTGDMYNSIKPTKAVKNEYGYYACVRPTGKDRNGVRNMDKLAYAEYGTSKEPATPMLTKAVKDAEPEVTAKMQELFNEAVSK